MLNLKNLELELNKQLQEETKQHVSLWLENKRFSYDFKYGDIVLYNDIKVKYLGRSGNKALIRSAGYSRYVNIDKINKIENENKREN